MSQIIDLAIDIDLLNGLIETENASGAGPTGITSQALNAVLDDRRSVLERLERQAAEG